MVSIEVCPAVTDAGFAEMVIVGTVRILLPTKRAHPEQREQRIATREEKRGMEIRLVVRSVCKVLSMSFRGDTSAGSNRRHLANCTKLTRRIEIDLRAHIGSLPGLKTTLHAGISRYPVQDSYRDLMPISLPRYVINGYKSTISWMTLHAGRDV